MISAVRGLSAIGVCGQSDEGSARLAAELQAELGVPSAAARSAEQLAAQSDILVTATTSRTPVVRGGWLPPGCTVLTVGSYEPDRRELDLAATTRADLITADDPVKASSRMRHTGRGQRARRAGPRQSRSARSSRAGPRGARADADVVLFHCTGLGIQDASLAWSVLELAAERQRGRTVEF